MENIDWPKSDTYPSAVTSVRTPVPLACLASPGCCACGRCCAMIVKLGFHTVVWALFDATETKIDTFCTV